MRILVFGAGVIGSLYRHSMKAPDEMRRLHEQFYLWLEQGGYLKK